MKLWKLAAIAFISTATAMAATQRATPSQEAAIRAHWNGCPFHDERLPDPEIASKQQRSLQFKSSFATGPSDPLGDAHKAAAAGEFRLFWESSMAGQSVVGATCRFPQYHPANWPTPFTLATISFSDVVGECRNRPNGCEIDARAASYAAAYNRAIISDARFPYPDLCTSGLQHQPNWRQPMLDDLGKLAAPWSIETDRPRTLAEAVRHGTRASLSGWISKAEPAEIDRQDDFALTPLAWAAIEGRTEAARMLITRGADPLAGCAPLRGDAHTIPFKIALQLGRRDIAAIMLPKAEPRLKPWPTAIITAAVKGDNVELVGRMLREDHERVSTESLVLLAQQNGSTAMIATLNDGTGDDGKAMVAIAISKRDLPLLHQALALKPPLNISRDPRQSLLGSAVLSGGEITDQIVRLLLDHGAAPESPAQWETSYPTGSQPSTALVGLVFNARRVRHGGADENAERLMASQLRTLDMLISAGASARKSDEHGRPLAVLAAVGRYGTINREELAPEWFRRLVSAGMDINATWQGGSALDWLDRMGLSNSESARTIASLGGRRVKPLPANAKL